MSKRKGRTFWEKAGDRLIEAIRTIVTGAFEGVGYRHLENEFRLSHYAPEITTSASRDMVVDRRNINNDRSVCRNKQSCHFHGPDSDDFRASHAREFQTRWLQEHIATTAGETE